MVGSRQERRQVGRKKGRKEGRKGRMEVERYHFETEKDLAAPEVSEVGLLMVVTVAR